MMIEPRSSSAIGKQTRLRRILSDADARTVIVTVDDALLAGPRAHLREVGPFLREVALGGGDAILGFRGPFLTAGGKLPTELGKIVNLTASTTLGKHVHKTLVGDIGDAIRVAADAVAVHVNISSAHEPEMLATLGTVASQSDRMGMPLLAIMYPRKEGTGGDDNYDFLAANDRAAYTSLVQHAARVGAELGADIIKTQYTGDAESFANVVEVCAPVPVVVAGGPLLEEQEALRRIQGALEAGAAGVSLGRNVFERRDAVGFLHKVNEIVHAPRAADGVNAVI